MRNTVLAKAPLTVQSNHGGVTLIDIMVALAISAVLLSIAVPAYQGYIERSHRAQAVRVLLESAACQERMRAGSGFYDTTRCAMPRAEGYRFEILPPNKTSTLEFRLVAIPAGELADDHCGALSLDHVGTRSAGAGTDRVSDCWGGR
ncbi:MAG: type IV pilin protein [Xanthomonadales bacterium]|nr:type IV pilin protein [Xanthomonadales bacterium]